MRKVVFILRNPNCLLVYRIGGLIPTGSPPTPYIEKRFGLWSLRNGISYTIFLLNLQLHRGELGVSVDNPSVNAVNFYLFLETLLCWPLGQPHNIEVVNQKHTLRSPLLLLVLFKLLKPNPAMNLLFHSH